MTQKIFDRPALARRRQRAASAPATFLLEHVAADAADRLSAVLRRFARCAEIGSLSPVVEERLRDGLGGRLWRLGPAAGRPDVVVDEEALPLRPSGLDLILSFLGLQLVDDLPGTLRQVRQALVPDGLFLGALVGGASLTELRQAFTAAEIEVEGGASPRVAPSVDVRDMGGLLQRAGFALPVVDSDVLVVRYDDAFALMSD